MASYSTSEFKGGLKVMLDGDPCNILENEHVKPGKGQAFNRVRLKNLKTGRVLEKTFKSGDTLEGADVSDSDMQYLYNDGEYWHFMALQQDDYCISKSFAADDEEIFDIFKILKALKAILIEIARQDV